ncbi:MAG: hypothetical protein HWN66_08475 [Candidatus Helarchaeota archaeon]|nr:hypothetical protein [Candidatus Helarchaeota archaeon]
MLKKNLSIAIPCTVLEDCSDLRSKTQKLGQIARACAIFKVKQIIIYSFNKRLSKRFSKDIEIIKEILEYLDCPQYLRKLIYPKLPIYRYVGILPPLRTPNHPLEKEIANIKTESNREGVVLSSNDQSSEVEIGLEKPIFINIPNLPTKKRVILRLKKRKNKLSGVLIEKAKIKEYWGYDVQIFKDSIRNFMKKFSNYQLIATSKKGTPIKKSDIEFFHALGEMKDILIIFGSPSSGLFEIFENQGLKLGDWVNLIINIAPKQGTQTIRVEEALLSTLTLVTWFISNLSNK